MKDWRQSLIDYASDNPQLKTEEKTAVTNQAQTKPSTSKGQPKTGKEAINTSKSQPKIGKEATNASKDQPKTGKEFMNTLKVQPKTGNEAMNTSKTQPKTGKEAINTSKTQPKTGKEALDTSKNPPKTGKRAIKNRCDICNANCGTLHDYQQHLEGTRHRNKCKAHIMCPLCQIFPERAKYKDHLISKSHMEKLTTSTVYKCKPCNIDLGSHANERMNFQKHLQSKRHAENTKNKFICPTCVEQYSTVPEFRGHLNNKTHLRNIGAIFCEKCDMVFLDQRVYAMHNESKEVARMHALICSACNFLKFTDPAHYENHLKSTAHNQTVAKQRKAAKQKAVEETRNKNNQSSTTKKQNDTKLQQFICDPCSFKSHDAREYEKHLAKEDHRRRLLRGMKSSKFNCEKCSVGFSSFDDYEQHLLSSEHIKKLDGHFICYPCKKDCLSYAAYRLHVTGATHRENNKVFKCSSCRESFQDQKAYGTHNRSDYHNLVSKLKQGKISLDHCPACNLTFSSLESVGEHIQDGEHIHIMSIRRKVTCLLCSWETSSVNQGVTSREYWKHMEEKQHVKQIEQLSRTFGSCRNM